MYITSESLEPVSIDRDVTHDIPFLEPLELPVGSH